MLWFLVWAVMVIGWLVGVFFGLRWLWRKAAALGRELLALEELAQHLTDAIANAPAPAQPAPIAVGTDGREAAERLEHLRARRRDRRDERRRRHAQRYMAWATLAGRAE